MSVFLTVGAVLRDGVVNGGWRTADGERKRLIYGKWLRAYGTLLRIHRPPSAVRCSPQMALPPLTLSIIAMTRSCALSSSLLARTILSPPAGRAVRGSCSKVTCRPVSEV